ncbi:MAG: GNAT family N-acetyltransferase [Acidimicrobiia bacterium]
MEVGSRRASADDLPVLVDLYRSLEKEMVALHPMWPLADGQAEPVEDSMARALEDQDTAIYLGTIDAVPVGLLLMRIEELLPQAGGARVAAIHLVFVDHDAREIGVGETMRDQALTEHRALGIRLFDAYVLPGHRLAKNFFEAGGFSARLIIMHHADE